MTLIDTHAHLDDERFDSDFPDVLSRAAQAGVKAQIAIATTAASAHKCTRLAAEHPSVYASAGIHPNHAQEARPGDWDEIMALAGGGRDSTTSGTRRIVALGETGLDRHWDYTPFPLQQDYFARHLALARQIGLPVVIHCREAESDMLAMLQEDFRRGGPVKGVMHSFSGDGAFAEACLGMGLYLSFAGMLTYKNAANLRAVAAKVPEDRILVETDAPYLTPEPLRGKVRRNEPAHVVQTAAHLAEIRGRTLEEIARATTENACRLFGITL
jgi:TatD DNase family protein